MKANREKVEVRGLTLEYTFTKARRATDFQPAEGREFDVFDIIHNGKSVYDGVYAALNEYGMWNDWLDKVCDDLEKNFMDSSRLGY